MSSLRIPWNKGKSGYKVGPASDDRKRKIGIANKGKKRTDEQKKRLSEAFKGRTPWNKGLTRFTSEKVNLLSLVRSGEKSHLWKGELIKYRAIHRRIESILGKPRYCENCMSTDKKVYDWSNKDHKYSIKKEDWRRLCRSCHIKYDRILARKPYDT